MKKIVLVLFMALCGTSLNAGPLLIVASIINPIYHVIFNSCMSKGGNVLTCKIMAASVNAKYLEDIEKDEKEEERRRR